MLVRLQLDLSVNLIARVRGTNELRRRTQKVERGASHSRQVQGQREGMVLEVTNAVEELLFSSLKSRPHVHPRRHESIRCARNKSTHLRRRL